MTETETDRQTDRVSSEDKNREKIARSSLSFFFSTSFLGMDVGVRKGR